MKAWRQRRRGDVACMETGNGGRDAEDIGKWRQRRRGYVACMEMGNVKAWLRSGCAGKGCAHGMVG